MARELAPHVSCLSLSTLSHSQHNTCHRHSHSRRVFTDALLTSQQTRIPYGNGHSTGVRTDGDGRRRRGGELRAARGGRGDTPQEPVTTNSRRRGDRGGEGGSSLCPGGDVTLHAQCTVCVEMITISQLGIIIYLTNFPPPGTLFIY